MKFEIEIPDVSILRVDKARIVTLSLGTDLHRIHDGRFGACEFNGTDRGNARFSPIRDMSGNIIPTIYAAKTFECSVCEIILRCPDTPPIDPATGRPTLVVVGPSDFELFKHSEIQTTIDLKLLDLTISGQRMLGVDHNALLAGPRSMYPATRDWAEAIHANFPDIHGIYYQSYQLGPDSAVVLFGDRFASGLHKTDQRNVSDAGCHSEILGLAENLSIEYIDI